LHTNGRRAIVGEEHSEIRGYAHFGRQSREWELSAQPPLRPLFDLVAPGFSGEKRVLTIRLVQIIFPGTGMLVLSAWCLGILNSQGRFFLWYTAPVFWNFAIIGVLLTFRHEPSVNELAVYAAWALLLGSILQFGVQLPSAIKLVPNLNIHHPVTL
jgi:peptidoglycan biosynthesis protein MviN/MurJ (putative lipid II flippase)